VSTRLVNVRLDGERLRKVRTLRRRGVVLSDLLREAIDRQFEALNEQANERDIRAIVGRILERYPDPPDLPVRLYDLRDRKEARHAIARKLRRAQRKPR
jgi:hypothetical protein